MENTKQLWLKIINDARFYDGTPEMLTRLTDHYEKWYDLKEKEQVKEIPDYIPVRIERCLHESGWKPYHITAYPYQVRGADKSFSTLSDLKEYYQIKKVSKIQNNTRGWAINSRGNKIVWTEYNAEISKIYIK